MRTSLLLAALSGVSAVAPVIITWASEPVQPGETLLLAGGGFDASCSATLSTTSPSVPAHNVTLPAVPGHATPSSLKFALPAAPALLPDVYALTLQCAAGSTGAPTLLNAASPWWAQGDAGERGSPGGWLRVSGLSMAWLSEGALAARGSARRAQRALRARGSRAAAAALLAAHAAGAAAPGAVRLTPLAGGAPVDLAPEPTNATQFSVYVALPPDLAPGEYALSVSNGRGAGLGGAFVPLDSFYDPASPRVTTFTVAPRAAWAPGVWAVSAPTLPAVWPFSPNATSDAELGAALGAAAAAGGGTVRLARGTFFLTAPLVLAPGVALVGSGAEHSVLFFAEATPASAPAAYISLNETLAAAAPGGVGAWELRDFSIVVTAFHYHIVAASNFTDGFVMDGVTIRANAFFAGNNAGTFGEGAPPGVQTVTHGRSANWTLEQPGNCLQLNARNFAITRNDMYCTYNAITSFASNGKTPCAGTSWPNSCHGATFGYLGDNVVRHGGASHFMNQWRQVIYERNTNIGSSVIAMGQSVGTGPDGGHDHHILHSENEITMVWGNDREEITFDDAGGSYFGLVSSVNGTQLTTAGDTKSSGDIKAGGWAGGCVVILNGTGAGQYRRVVVPGAGPGPVNPDNRTWILDAPWTLPPDATSYIQITPYRGRNLFVGDLFTDGGAIQYYGQALDNVIADSTFERVTGVLAWGQWRGWVPPNQTLTTGTPEVGGQMGNGLMPNLRNQYLRNAFLGSWSSPNYNYSGSGAAAFYARRFYAVQPMPNNTPQNISGNTLLVYRGNSGGGGYNFGSGASKHCGGWRQL